MMNMGPQCVSLLSEILHSQVLPALVVLLCLQLAGFIFGTYPVLIVSFCDRIGLTQRILS